MWRGQDATTLLVVREAAGPMMRGQVEGLAWADAERLPLQPFSILPGGAGWRAGAAAGGTRTIVGQYWRGRGEGGVAGSPPRPRQ